jgi:hypothetical protein
MKVEPTERESRPTVAQSEETTYRQGLCRKWTSRYGQRRNGLSRLSGIGSAGVLVIGIPGVAASVYWAHIVPYQTASVVIGAMVIGLVACQTLNRHFLVLEKQAFIQIEQLLEGNPATHKKLVSPFYLLAKMATKPRVDAKRAWVEQRMNAFLSRRAQKERQADIFERQSLRLGSIHGSTEVGRTLEYGG